MDNKLQITLSLEMILPEATIMCEVYDRSKKNDGINKNQSLKILEEETTNRVLNKLQEAVGIVPRSISKKSSGQRNWPKNYIGSISHKLNYVICALVKTSNISALGIDLEVIDGSSLKQISKMITNKEIINNAEEELHRIFSTKEAVFKAYYPLKHHVIDFQDVEINWINKNIQNKIYNGTAICPNDIEMDIRSIVTGAWVISVAIVF